MAGASTTHLVAAGLGLLFFGWVIFLAGISGMQNRCDEDDVAKVLLPFAQVDTFDISLKCKKAFRFWWFIIVFELVAIFGAAITLAGGLFQKTRLSWLGLFSVATILYIYATNTFLFAGVDTVKNFPGNNKDRIKTALAGSLITATLNSVMVILFGLDTAPPPPPVAAGKTADTQASQV